MCVCMYVCVLVAQSCPTLWDPMDYSPPGSSVHGILQARILEWGAISFSCVSFPKNPFNIYCKANLKVELLVSQSCPTLCNPKDCSPPGSSVHRILQARILEWGASHSLFQGIFLTQGSNLHLPHCRLILYCLSHQGTPTL